MARAKSRPVTLSASDREWLHGLVRTGSQSAQQVRRARILLELDQGDPDRDGPVPVQAVVAERAGVCLDTVVKVSRAYAERGGDVRATVSRKKRLVAPVPPKVTAEIEERIIALACSPPPAGHTRWSLRLLERRIRLIDDAQIPDLDYTTISRILRRRRFALV